MTPARTSDDPAPKDAPPSQSLFRAQALRQASPGIFGEVVLHASVASWMITAIATLAIAALAAVLLLIDVDGTPLWRWLLAR